MWRAWRTVLVMPVAAIVATLPPQAFVVVPVAMARAGSPGSTGPPGLRILSGSVHGGGDVFMTPRVGGRYGSGGLEILSRAGKVLWFKAVRSGETAANLRLQTLDGRAVLTYW